jgi:adenine-specific DNA-methyltransferase
VILLADSGSIFVQIGDENVHRVRALLDEVFGDENHIAEIKFRTTSNRTAEFIPSIFDTILFYAKAKSNCKFRRPFTSKDYSDVTEDSYGCVEINTFEWRRLRREEKDNPTQAEQIGPLFGLSDLTSSHRYIRDVFQWQGKEFTPKKRYWSTSLDGLQRLGRANRLCDVNGTLRYRPVGNKPAISGHFD